MSTSPCGYTCKTRLPIRAAASFMTHKKKSHYSVFSNVPIHQLRGSLEFGVFFRLSQSFSQSASLCLVTERRDVSEQVFQGAQGLHFCLRRDWWGRGRVTGSCSLFSAHGACLALTRCAMFSEGTSHSAVTQTDRRRARTETEHERDWESSKLIPRWSLRAEGCEFLIIGAGQLDFSCGGHTRTWRWRRRLDEHQKSGSISRVIWYEREQLAARFRFDLFSTHLRSAILALSTASINYQSSCVLLKTSEHIPDVGRFRRV